MEQCRGGCSHEMVNSPATAATMAYPTLEEERRSSWHEHGHDHVGCRRRRRQRQPRSADQAVDYHETLRRDLDSFSAVCSPCLEQHDHQRHVHDESCTGCFSRGPTATILNRNFAHSYQQPVPGPSGRQLPELPIGFLRPANGQIQRRSRKQSQPRKVTEVEEDEDLICPPKGIKQQEEEQKKQEEKQEQATEKPETQIDILKEKYRSPSSRRRLLKCRRCPKSSLARGCICPPYHSKASLVLHSLWRHNTKSRSRDRLENQLPSDDNPVSQVSSITLKATVYTNPTRYDYHR